VTAHTITLLLPFLLPIAHLLDSSATNIQCIPDTHAPFSFEAKRQKSISNYLAFGEDLKNSFKKVY